MADQCPGYVTQQKVLISQSGHSSEINAYLKTGDEKLLARLTDEGCSQLEGNWLCPQSSDYAKRLALDCY
jgi:hypothetical protein